jgi:hypothetical protein
VPETLKPRVGRLIDWGAVERVGRKLILSRALYADMGQRATYTRRKGLDHGAQKELLLQHIRDNAADGSPLSELAQVLPNVTERRVKRLLQELKAEGKIEPSGRRRWARWRPVSAQAENTMNHPSPIPADASGPWSYNLLPDNKLYGHTGISSGLKRVSKR